MSCALPTTRYSFVIAGAVQADGAFQERTKIRIRAFRSSPALLEAKNSFRCNFNVERSEKHAEDAKNNCGTHART